MTHEEAVQKVGEVFPFPGYINADFQRYITILTTVFKYLHPPSKILDFGAGPAEKTAMLATLGFDCAACDDLKDDWHQFPGNRDKILNFVKMFKIRYHVAKDHALPFRAGEFDMIMMHDVLEHLHDSPCNLINDLLEILKPEGLIFITVPMQLISEREWQSY
jgi:SAM-dependent methyltransferase